MPRRLSVLLPTFLGCCVPICLYVAVFSSIKHILLIPVLIVGSLFGPLTLIYFSFNPTSICVILILTVLLIAMMVAHPIKMRRWAAIATIIGVFIWMSIGFSGFLVILSYAGYATF